MPHTPLSHLIPDKFNTIGDEEDAFDSHNEDTENESGQDESSDDTAAEQGRYFDFEISCKVLVL